MVKTRATDHKNPRLMAQARNVAHKFSSTAEMQVRHDLPQEEKISHALQTLLTIEAPEGSSLSTYRSALDLIVVAWNISLQAPENQAQMLRDIVEEVFKADPAIQRDALANMQRLVICKQVFFPDDKRLIVSWEVRFNGPKIYVSAAALMAPADAPPTSQV